MIPLDAIQPLNFPQYNIKNFETEEVGPFDISAEGLDIPPDFRIDNRFSQIYYNWALLNKLIVTEQQDVERLLEYQARIFRDSEMWLKDLFFLIKVNWETFCDLGVVQEFVEIQGIVSFLTKKYDSNASAMRYFARKNSIDQVRLRLKQLKNDDVKREYLLGRKQEYLNDKPPGYVEDGAPFDQLIDLELQKLKDEKKEERNWRSSPCKIPFKLTN